MSMLHCIPAIGLGEIYDKVEVGSIIEYKSKNAKTWSKAEVIKKKIDKVWDSEVHNIMIFTERNRDVFELRDLTDFHWRYNDLYDCNKYLLKGYKAKTKNVRLLDSNNVKRIYEHIETPKEYDAILQALKQYNIISKEDIDNNTIKISNHKKNNRKNGKTFIKVFNNDVLIKEFWFEIHSVYVANCGIPKTWAVDLKRKELTL